MCGNQKGSTTATQAPNGAAMQAYQNLMERAQGVAQTPYQGYTGELVAPVNPQQSLGVSGINQYANWAQPYIQNAAGMATSAAAPITQGQIQQYESPYTQDVVNATQNQFNNQNAQQREGFRGNAISQGAMGGSREAIGEAELANQQNLAQAPVIAGLENQGYTTGLNTALTEQQARAQGAYSLGNLGVAGQNAGLTGANAQIGAGSLEQQTQQAQDAAQYQQFLNQLAYPFQTTQWLAGIDSGIGSQMGGTSTTTPPAPSTASQALGAGAGGVGLLGSMGAFGSAGWLMPALAALARGGAVHHGGVAEPISVPESRATLHAQQKQLREGHRRVQMFPRGTRELALPRGMSRTETLDGHVFHFDPRRIDASTVHRLSDAGRENDMLDLGPHSHVDVMRRAVGGEVPMAIVERDPSGTEVRAAAATHTTAPATFQAMHATKSPGHTLTVEHPMDVIGGRLAAQERQGYDVGGGVVMPYAGAKGWVPTAMMATGRPNMPGAAPAQPQSSLMDQASKLGQVAAMIRKGSNNGVAGATMSLGAPGVGQASPGGVGDYMPSAPADILASESPIYFRGGGVRGYADGGSPTSFFNDEWDAANGAIRDGSVDPVGPENYVDPDGPPHVGVAHDAAPPDEDEDDADAGAALSYAARSRGHAPSIGVVPSAAPTNGVAAPSGVDWSSNSKLWPALAAAGFGMLASRSPYPGVAVGEGGLTGLGAYTKAQELAQQQAMSERKVDLEAKRLAQEADLAHQRLHVQSMPYEQMTTAQKAELALKQQRPVVIGQTTEMDPSTGTIKYKNIYGVKKDDGFWYDPVTGKRVQPGSTSASPPVPLGLYAAPGAPAAQPAPPPGPGSQGWPEGYAAGGDVEDDDLAASGADDDDAVPPAVGGPVQLAQVTPQPGMAPVVVPPQPQGGGGLFGIPGENANLIGEDYLNQFSPSFRAAVVDYYNGRSIPTANPRDPRFAYVKRAAQKYGADVGDPMDETKYASRRTFRNQLGSAAAASVGGQRNLITTSLGHLADVAERAEAMNNWSTGINPLSHLVNNLRSETDAQHALANALGVARHRFAGEVERLYAGGKSAQAAQEETAGHYADGNTPRDFSGALGSDLDLIRSKLQTLQDQKEIVFGKDSGSDINLLTPSAISNIQRVRGVIDRLNGIDGKSRATQLQAQGLKGDPLRSRLHAEGYDIPGLPAQHTYNHADQAIAETKALTGPLQIDPRDADALRANRDNPAAAAAIDRKYGVGAAQRVLNGGP